MIQPILKRVGGKRSVLSRIDPYLPGRCEHYFEPFFGGGAMFFKLASDDRIDGRAWLADADPGLIEFYQELLGIPLAVLSEYDDLVAFNCREGFYEVRDAYNGNTPRCDADMTTRAAQYLYINQCGYNGLFRCNKSGKCNVPYGGDSRKPKSSSEIHKSGALMALKADRPVCATFDKPPATWPEPNFGDLVYCDPPYTGTFDAYTKEGWGEADDRRLYAKCLEWRDNGAYVVVSTADPDIWRSEFDVEPIYTSAKIKHKERTEYVCYTG